MAITASRVINEKYDPTATAFDLTAGEQLYAGYPLVIKPADGKVYMITTDGYVAGWSSDDVETGDKVKVQTGTVELPVVAGVDSVDVGQSAYITDDGAVATVSAAGQYAGKIVAAERSGYVFIKFGYPIYV